MRHRALRYAVLGVLALILVSLSLLRFARVEAIDKVVLGPPSIQTPPVVKVYAISSPRGSLRVGNPRQIRKTIADLRPLHEALPEPGYGDWLQQHDEPGQTFNEYLNRRPVTPTGARTFLYVQPLGEFTERERQIVDLSAEYLSIYMNRPVKVLEDLPLSIIPAEARRGGSQDLGEQLLTTHILYDVLKPRLPIDAAAYIAFTASDLWPGRGWNFVFGQASLRNRVGVWSMHRFGDPSASAEEFRQCLRRTLKTASHETGHMFSMRHCIAYRCNLCGANHQRESDRHPLYLCPQCHAKIAWATGADPVERFRRLAEFCHRERLAQTASYYERAIQALTD